mgnify:CR=1 FL=1
MCDMAHISGLVATEVADDPFKYCDIVTTTTHKSLRGPRAGMIFFKLDDRDFKTKINNAVFPSLQGGPHVHQIAGIATQLKEVMTQEFKDYANQVVKNSRALAAALTKRGHTLCSGGTSCVLLTHLKHKKKKTLRYTHTVIYIYGLIYRERERDKYIDYELYFYWYFLLVYP